MKNSSEEINYLTFHTLYFVHMVEHTISGGKKSLLIEKENVFSVVYHAESVSDVSKFKLDRVDLR